MPEVSNTTKPPVVNKPPVQNENDDKKGGGIGPFGWAAAFFLFINIFFSFIALAILGDLVGDNDNGKWITDPEKGVYENTGIEDDAGGGTGACKWSVVKQDQIHTNIVSVRVPIWKYTGKGNVSSTMTLRVHRNCADEILNIFTKVYNSTDKPPIETSDTACEGFRKSVTSRHQRGVACDVNWNENWCAPNCYNHPGQKIGNFWKPGNISPDNTYAAWVSGFDIRSIPINGTIANAFKDANWGRGLYRNGFDDIMHFSVDGH